MCSTPSAQFGSFITGRVDYLANYRFSGASAPQMVGAAGPGRPRTVRRTVPTLTAVDSAPPRRNGFNGLGEFLVQTQIHGAMADLCACRTQADVVAILPIGLRPDWTRRKAAAAIRADVEQSGLDAVRTERAFIGADPRIRCVRRQVAVAIFAVRSELQRHLRKPSFGGAHHRRSPRRCE